MSNQSNDFNTPPKILEPIRKFWGDIDLDPCSNNNSMVNAIESWSLPINGLARDWHGNTFVNPPYAPYYFTPEGTCLSPKEHKNSERSDCKRYTIKDWAWKGANEKKIHSVESIFLVPARGMGSSLWQDIILPLADSICFLKERYPFWENGEPCKGPDGDINPPTFDCSLVYFGWAVDGFKKIFIDYGFCFPR